MGNFWYVKITPLLLTIVQMHTGRIKSFKIVQYAYDIKSITSNKQIKKNYQENNGIIFNLFTNLSDVNEFDMLL